MAKRWILFAAVHDFFFIIGNLYYVYIKSYFLLVKLFNVHKISWDVRIVYCTVKSSETFRESMPRKNSRTLGLICRFLFYTRLVKTELWLSELSNQVRTYLLFALKNYCWDLSLTLRLAFYIYIYTYRYTSILTVSLQFINSFFALFGKLHCLRAYIRKVAHIIPLWFHDFLWYC